MKNERYTEMSRFLSGEMDPAEEVAFRRELERDPDTLRELRQMEITWKWYDIRFSGSRNDSRQAWGRLRHRLEQDGMLEETQPAGSPFFQSGPWRVAAAVILVVALGFPALFFGLQERSDRTAPRSHYAEKGVRTVDLPDGSRVFLNQGSGLSYPEEFIHQREVRLSGEAFFEVMSDPANPFTVRSGKVVVSVLGTSFNVKKAKPAGEVEVFVENGRVRVAQDDSPQYMTLEKGELARVGDGMIDKGTAVDPNYISWKTKEFKFVDAELDEVLKELEESYHVEIVADEEVIEGLMITTSYMEQSIDSILETIATAFGLSVTLRDSRYYLTQ